MIEIALFQPEIPPNTGNIIRLCANTGSRLHLIHPLGFQLDEKRLQRAGLDYHELACVVEHENFEHFLQAMANRRLFACTTKGTVRYCDIRYQSQDVLLFGPESRGLPESVLHHSQTTERLTIPMQKQARSLNLSNAVAVMAYEAWRQLDFI